MFFAVDFSGKLPKYVDADPRLLSIHSSTARELKWRYIMKKVNLRDQITAELPVLKH